MPSSVFALVSWKKSMNKMDKRRKKHPMQTKHHQKLIN